ncbi:MULTISPECIES: helix-turn-helix domain-containing protein [unclassified Lysinibacillus]|uniref:helix-turn-helix transcriptional regulator n=1 Tax=unclassified Lysinibacillus TaxID=2636778 RepID=UPI002553660B|nr:MULTISPECIES: helix-turn-helix domain-containing protein [unclassified Lysinibacillus]MDM5250987.1 helix-turn-helix domain-containing protein [Lysinibacillus sp. G4S2]
MLKKFLRSKKKNEEWRGGNPNGRPKVAINELKLLHLKDTGKSNREIARILGVSEATIRRRLKDIEMKIFIE